MIKKILILLMLLASPAYAVDFTDTDTVYGWNGAAQFYPTWLEFKTQLGGELDLTDITFNMGGSLSNLLYDTGSNFLLDTDTSTNHVLSASKIISLDSAVAATAANGDNITSGTVADARIASTLARDSEITSANTNVIEWHFNSDALGVSATVPDENMMFRVPTGVTYGNLYVSCDGTTHTGMAIDIAYAATRGGTYTDEGTALTGTFTHGATAESAIDVSGYGTLTAGQYISARISTASTGDATYCDASLTLTNN